MGPALLFVAAAGLYAVLPEAARGGAVTGTVLPIALAIAFAIAVAGRASSGAVVGGAVGALFGSIAWSIVPGLGGAIVVGLAYVERTWRVRGRPARIAHAALAVVAGAAGGSLAAAYAGSAMTYRAVAVAMGAILSAAPLFIAADDARVVALEKAAKRLSGPVSAALVDAADLLRCGDPTLLDKETAANVEKSWRSLDRLVDARLAMLTATARRGETAAMVTAMVERQITEHVVSLTRAYSAATTVGAAEVGIDDSAIRDVHARGEALEEQTRAIVEVRQ